MSDNSKENGSASPVGSGTSGVSTSPKPKRGRGRGTLGKDAIVQSTRELLREVSPANLSRKMVAEAAGVDPALVRYYFQDLRHLLTEVLKLLVADYRERYDRLGINPSDPAEALEKRIRHLVTFLSEEPSFHGLFIEQIVNGQDEWARKTRDAFTDKFFGELDGLIETGRENGTFRGDFDSRFLYLAIIGASQFLGTSGPIFNRLFKEDCAPTDVSADYARFLTDTVLHGMKKRTPED